MAKVTQLHSMCLQVGELGKPVVVHPRICRSQSKRDKWCCPIWGERSEGSLESRFYELMCKGWRIWSLMSTGKGTNKQTKTQMNITPLSNEADRTCGSFRLWWSFLLDPSLLVSVSHIPHRCPTLSLLTHMSPVSRTHLEAHLTSIYAECALAVLWISPNPDRLTTKINTHNSHGCLRMNHGFKSRAGHSRKE